MLAAQQTFSLCADLGAVEYILGELERFSDLPGFKVRWAALMTRGTLFGPNRSVLVNEENGRKTVAIQCLPGDELTAFLGDCRAGKV